MYMHNGMTDQMVAYHRERLVASMRAAESDRDVMLRFRAKLGSLLISLGQRLRGESVRELIASSSSPSVTPTLQMHPQGECA